MAYAGSALFRVRNSASSRVKMSFVTAAMEYLVRSSLHSASMRAVLPEPTGLRIGAWLAMFVIPFPSSNFKVSECHGGVRDKTQK